MPIHFESEVACKSRFRWDKPKRRAEASSRVVFAYICTCGSFPLAERISVGFMSPTVHGLHRVDRARTRRDGTVWGLGGHGRCTGGRSLRCSAFQAEPGNEEEGPAIEHAGTSESLAAAALWLRVKRATSYELRSTLYKCLEECSVDEKSNDCPNRYGQW